MTSDSASFRPQDAAQPETDYAGKEQQSRGIGTRACGIAEEAQGQQWVLGLGQGLALSPLTVAGVAGVPAQDAGAASGLVNAAHQLGGSLGLALLVVVFSSGTVHADDARIDVAQRVANCLGVSAVLLALSLMVVLASIVRREGSVSEPVASKSELTDGSPTRGSRARVDREVPTCNMSP